MRKKIYGESRNDKCVFCNSQASVKNSQGLPTCIAHTKKVMEDKRCSCGEWMEIKQSKWGAFFLCNQCGPRSISKTEDMEMSGYKLNKRFRQQDKEQTISTNTTKKPLKKINYEPNKVYTIDELERMWDSE
jgi:hypothetical protein